MKEDAMVAAVEAAPETTDDTQRSQQDTPFGQLIATMTDESHATLFLTRSMIKKLATLEILIGRDLSDERLVGFMDHLAELLMEYSEQVEAYTYAVHEFNEAADQYQSADPDQVNEVQGEYPL